MLLVQGISSRPYLLEREAPPTSHLANLRALLSALPELNATQRARWLKRAAKAIGSSPVLEAGPGVQGAVMQLARRAHDLEDEYLVVRAWCCVWRCCMDRSPRVQGQEPQGLTRCTRAVLWRRRTFRAASVVKSLTFPELAALHSISRWEFGRQTFLLCHAAPQCRIISHPLLPAQGLAGSLLARLGPSTEEDPGAEASQPTSGTTSSSLAGTHLGSAPSQATPSSGTGPPPRGLPARPSARAPHKAEAVPGPASAPSLLAPPWPQLFEALAAATLDADVGVVAATLRALPGIMAQAPVLAALAEADAETRRFLGAWSDAGRCGGEGDTKGMNSPSASPCCQSSPFLMYDPEQPATSWRGPKGGVQKPTRPDVARALDGGCWQGGVAGLGVSACQHRTVHGRPRHIAPIDYLSGRDPGVLAVCSRGPRRTW